MKYSIASFVCLLGLFVAGCDDATETSANAEMGLINGDIGVMSDGEMELRFIDAGQPVERQDGGMAIDAGTDLQRLLGDASAIAAACS